MWNVSICVMVKMCSSDKHVKGCRDTYKDDCTTLCHCEQSLSRDLNLMVVENLLMTAPIAPSAPVEDMMAEGITIVWFNIAISNRNPLLTKISCSSMNFVDYYGGEVCFDMDLKNEHE